jgi:large subunit ribosomal protein L18
MSIGQKVVKGSATKARARRHFRLRKRVVGTPERPRLVVSRSARHLFVQLLMIQSRKALVSASTMEKDLRAFAGDKTAKAEQVGELIAKRAKERELQQWYLTAVETNSTDVLQQLQQVLVQMDWSSNG